MALEIVRRFVNGAWKTEAAEAGGGGSQPSGASRWLGPCKINCFTAQTILAVVPDQPPDGGTFTLTLNGETTAAIAWDATNAAVALALQALPSVGADNAVTDPQNGDPNAPYDISRQYEVVFKDLIATALLVLDTSGLTGPSAPYTGDVAIAPSFLVEMFTPAVGDIVEDFMHAIPAAWPGGVLLQYTDNPSNPSNGNAPVWANPVPSQGVDGLDLAAGDEYTNFSGSNTNGVEERSTSLLALTAQWALSGGAELYGNLPASVKTAVPIYSYISVVPTNASQGEVWIWVKTATPAPLMD